MSATTFSVSSGSEGRNLSLQEQYPVWIFPSLHVSSRIISRRRSKFSRPRLAVSAAAETSLRLGQKTHKSCAGRICVSFVRPVGVEPTTIRLRGVCSTN
jgi:hypothetical protein